ncbi:ras-related protein Rab-1-like [Corticium candelabrum]|uniref:ras-related protein Rab-1-like n=1 Tax=Corticium candelabrum TaxID=121492 RepID=UPI002E2762B2|nr:ras-related protein Rab-1-like [Corticium candelabrum]
MESLSVSSLSVLKVMVVGDISVGKTSLLRRFHEHTFDETQSGFSVGVDFVIHNIRIDGKVLKLHLWDTAGEERHRSLTEIYYRGTLGAMLVFDVSQRQSIENIKTYWLPELLRRTESDVAKVLVGNKSDLEAEVSCEEARDVAASYGMSYIETSAKLDSNVNEAFTTLTQMITERFSQEQLSTPSTTASPMESLFLHEHNQPSAGQGTWACCP